MQNNQHQNAQDALAAVKAAASKARQHAAAVSWMVSVMRAADAAHNRVHEDAAWAMVAAAEQMVRMAEAAAKDAAVANN